MATTNPYSTPQSPFDADEETYEPHVLSFDGRIGRLRYLAYSIPWGLLTWVAFLVLGIVAAIVVPAFASGSEAAAGIIGIVAALVMVVIAYIPVFGLAKRRLNDMNQSGWLSLILIIPFVNFIFLLVLLFAPGTQGTNRYGPQPCENSGLVIVGALFFPLSFVAVIGILAAIALPAYQDYTVRAQITDALNQAYPVRDKVEMYYQENNEFPAQNQDIDHHWRSTSPNVQSIDVATGGVITVVMESNNEMVKEKTIVLRPSLNNDDIEWDCTGGDLAEKYRPSLCRSPESFVP